MGKMTANYNDLQDIMSSEMTIFVLILKPLIFAFLSICKLHNLSLLGIKQRPRILADENSACIKVEHDR
jgi:hypothetical protein